MNYVSKTQEYVVSITKKTEEWMKDQLRPFFCDVVDDPRQYAEFIGPRFASGEFEFCHERGILEGTYFLKHNGEVIASITHKARLINE